MESATLVEAAGRLSEFDAHVRESQSNVRLDRSGRDYRVRALVTLPPGLPSF
jgi:hypothetical protein